MKAIKNFKPLVLYSFMRSAFIKFHQNGSYFANCLLTKNRLIQNDYVLALFGYSAEIIAGKWPRRILCPFCSRFWSEFGQIRYLSWSRASISESMATKVNALCGWSGRWYVWMLHRWSNCSLARTAMDGRIVRCGTISSCQSAAISESVKSLLVIWTISHRQLTPSKLMILLCSEENSRHPVFAKFFRKVSLFNVIAFYSLLYCMCNIIFPLINVINAK